MANAMHENYELVVIGTSVLWGQGLREDQKIHTRIKRMLEASDKKRPDPRPIHVSFLAHSGATIGFKQDKTEDTTIKARVFGEVPTHYPTLLQQLAEYDQGADSVPPEKVTAVLVEGGINDVDVMKIFDPLTTSRGLKRRIQRYCNDHMRLLLERIAARFPNARIVVLSYYQMLSQESEDGYISEFLRAVGAKSAGRLLDLPVDLLSDLAKGRILRHTNQFHVQSREALRSAVDAVNAELSGQRRIFLAEPAFTGNNTAFAPDPWLFALNPDLSPQDEVVTERECACDEVGPSRTDVTMCKSASNGHPNRKGAQAYAEAIVTELLR